MSSYTALFSLVAIALLSSSCYGQGFLSQKPEFSSASLRAEVKGVLGEVLGAGHGVAHSRLASIRATIAPIFQALPKNNKGHLSKAVMRYAVRRYFSQQYAWIVKGFEPHAELVNTSDSANVLHGKLPAFLRSVFEEKFAHEGFALDDVVSMVAAVERLTFDEVVRMVESSYWLNDMSVMDELSNTEMMDVLSSYLIMSMLGGSTDKAQHQFDKKYINLRYPHWDTTLLFLIDIAGSDIFERSSYSNPFVREKTFSFTDLIRMSERISEEFGPWSDHECHEMKDLLVQKDVHGSGRLKLSDFYRKSEDGAWQFTEPSEYLRQIGAIDDASPSLGPQVLIPNYITGMSNCISSAPYYNICCLNECDKIYQHLEAQIPSSTTTPTELLKALESLPNAPDVSEALRNRLQEISETNQGNVPLHGRLVAQWLHFSFPHECPYPHEAGTIAPKTPEQWRAEYGEEQDTVSEEEVAQILEMDRGFGPVSFDEAMQNWKPSESLLLASTPSDENDNIWPNRLRVAVQLCMVLSCVAVVLRQLTSAVGPMGKDKKVEAYDV